MPIYVYECIQCRYEFEEIRKDSIGSGKSKCPKCSYLAFKIPSTFSANIFQQRKFGDGTTTPDFVRTPKQEKAWMKAEGITYDPPQSVNLNYINKKAREAKRKTAMEQAFADAAKKINDGFKIPEKKGVKMPKKLGFQV